MSDMNSPGAGKPVVYRKISSATPIILGIVLILGCSASYLLGVYSGTSGGYTHALVYLGIEDKEITEDGNEATVATWLGSLDTNAAANRRLYPARLADTQATLFELTNNSLNRIKYMDRVFGRRLEAIEANTAQCAAANDLIIRATQLGAGK